MKKFFFLSLLFLTNLVFSVELPDNKKKIWNIQATYAKLYNYRYARTSANSYLGPELMAYLDTGNIACYTNSIGVLVQRNLWKFIYLQTGLSFSRRGYLDSYVLSDFPPYKILPKIPWKVISIPITIYVIHNFKNSLQIGAGLGFEESLYYNIRNYDRKISLKENSNGFFGYRWNKNRLLDPNTLIDVANEGFGLRVDWILQTQIGFPIFRNIAVLFRLSYSSWFRFNEVTRYGGDPTLNMSYTYEMKSYFISSSVSLSYSF